MNVSFQPQIVSVSASSPSAEISLGTPIVKDYVDRDPYIGSYTVTPTTETQTLQTNNKRMTNNIVVNPIPSNYGLITWNGSVLTVS